MRQDEITTSVDLAVPVTENDLTIFDEIDTIVDDSISKGNLRSVLMYGRNLRKGMQLHGLALAKLLYRIYESWNIFVESGITDEFVDVIYAEMGVPASTTYKYVGMWRAIFENNTIPDNIKKILMGKPVKSLLLLTAGANEGSIDWEQVIEAVTHQEIAELVKETRGVKTSGVNRITIRLLRDGSLMAYKGEEEPVMVGSFFVNVTDEHESIIINKVIDRLVSAAGLIKE